MSEKNAIIGALGERKLLLPALVNSALAAAGQAKYLLALLEVARQRAQRPQAGFSRLQQERLACGLDEEEELDEVIQASRVEEGDTYRVPHAGRILELAWHAVRSMLEPLREGERARDAGELEKRFQAILLQARARDGELIDGRDISLLTCADREPGDSLHLLVIDVQEALKRLQAGIAAESLDGARVYEIRAHERGAVRAFMRGVNQTAALKFDHPGLGTTATHSGDRLVIQNDIGTTDAHVLVVHVAGQAANVIYTDVHLQRLLFFESLFERYYVRWEDTVSRKDNRIGEGVYHLSAGRYEAGSRAELEDYLAFLGSRLVFLIDWNRARKRLRNFVPRDRALALLKWAAEENLGHMAFLRCGGETLVQEAMEFVVHGTRLVPQRLDELLGPDEALQYLQFVLRTCSEGLRQGRPEGLIRDEVKAELLTYARSAQQSLLDIAAEHGGLIAEIAGSLRDALLALRLAGAPGDLERNARRAREWERRADALVSRAREAVRAGGEGAFFRDLVSAADRAADDLEEAAFHFTLLPGEWRRAEASRDVVALAGLLVQGAQEYVKALESARYVHRGAQREDVQDFLEAIHRIVAVEQRADEAHRGVKRALMLEPVGQQGLYVYGEAVKSMERSAGSLVHAGLMLRDYALREAAAR